jgi:hypothetical protein
MREAVAVLRLVQVRAYAKKTAESTTDWRVAVQPSDQERPGSGATGCA